jgi:hypothetical protein
VLAGVGIVPAVIMVTGRPAGQVYTVAQVAAGLRHNPRTWVGRTVLVRGAFTAVAYGSVRSASGYGQGSCGIGGTCAMGLPTDVALHSFLVGPTPRSLPAYERMVAALFAAHAPQLAALNPALPVSVAPPGNARRAPPVLVVLVRPHRVQPAWARLSQIAQRAASNLPDGSWTTLAQLPLVGPFLGQLLMPGEDVRCVRALWVRRGRR